MNSVEAAGTTRKTQVWLQLTVYLSVPGKQVRATAGAVILPPTSVVCSGAVCSVMSVSWSLVCRGVGSASQVRAKSAQLSWWGLLPRPTHAFQ